MSGPRQRNVVARPAAAGRRVAAVALAAWVVLAGAAEVGACPVCESAAGAEVRAGIFDDRFGETLALSALPFAVMLGVVAAVHLSGGPGRRSPAEDTHGR